MHYPALAATALTVLACIAPASAQIAPATPQPLVYEDEALKFVPAPGYVRLQGPVPPKISDLEDLTPVAAWVKNARQDDQHTIIIAMEGFSGASLDEWESRAENEIRTNIDGALVRDKHLERLANGMSAIWIKVLFGEGFDAHVEYGYCVYDGLRGVFAAVSARVGELTPDQAKDELHGLTAVLHPGRS